MQLRAFPIHIIAAAAALIYAGYVSQSAFVATGLQFVTPLVVIMVVHLGWLALQRRLTPGFSQSVLLRSAQTAVGMAGVILLSSIFAPKPAEAADAGEIISGFLGILFCVAVIAFIVGLIGLVIYAIFKLIGDVYRMFGNGGDEDPKSRLFDIAGLAVAVTALGLLSLEGTTQKLSFNQTLRGEASVLINQAPNQVWDTLQTATSPEFPLPNILSLFPKPIGVTTDEGTDLGAMRRVAFEGREGEGYLTLQVVERTPETAVFEVLSDTSPFAMWLAYDRLTYRVDPAGMGTRLTVTLDYDRLLAPAWFFGPATKGAAHLAMDVLARDVKTRAEAAR